MVTRNLVAALLFILIGCGAAQSQIPSSDLTTIRVESRLVLVDVIPEYENLQLHRRALLTGLQRDDFRVFDNGKGVDIKSVDFGAARSTRPIALWLIVQCPMKYDPGWHSGFIRARTKLLRPALTHLDANDAVGVAHWCDTGEAQVDLPPGHDADAALKTVEDVMAQKGIEGKSRTGELAMQSMIHMIVRNTRESIPDRLPVMLFLYNDYSGTYSDEAEKIVEDVLETSGIVFGLSNDGWPFEPSQQYLHNGQIAYLVHRYAEETGGAFYTAPNTANFSTALDYILAQVHLRYALGFKPETMDGKRHTIKVELSADALKRYPGVQLRYRQAYVPVAPSH
jgi:hypothetical protein